MTKTQRLRRQLSVERAHRMRLESNIEILIELLANTREPAISTRANLRHLLQAVQAGGRHTRRLDVRYLAVVQEHVGPVEALQHSEVPGLLGEGIQAGPCPASPSGLSEQRVRTWRRSSAMRVSGSGPGHEALPGE